MSDPFKYRIRAEVRKFLRTVECEVEATEEALLHEGVFENEKVLFIERQEDLYASHHYKGKVAVRVTRDSYRRGKVIAYD